VKRPLRSVTTLRLTSASDAIDLGEPGCSLLAADRDGTTRPRDGDGDGTARPDAGPFEFVPDATVDTGTTDSADTGDSGPTTPVDTGETATDTGDDDDKGGPCSCSSGPLGSVPAGLLLVPLVLVRRRTASSPCR
jgi:hypothetical protein